MNIKPGMSKVLLFLVVFISISKTVLFGYSIVEYKGKVFILRDQKIVYENIKKYTLVPGNSIIKTGRDSSVTLSHNGSYVKIYAYSRVLLKSEPVLLYGKMAKSGNNRYLDLHFNFRPLPVQGGSSQIGRASCRERV